MYFRPDDDKHPIIALTSSVTPRWYMLAHAGMVRISIGSRAYQPSKSENRWNGAMDFSNCMRNLYSSIAVAHHPTDLGAGDAWRLSGRLLYPNMRGRGWKNLGNAMNTSYSIRPDFRPSSGRGREA